MHHATLCYYIEGDNVLLALKKRGFGEGNLNGYGGKVKKRETYLQAAIRETEEEANIKVSQLEKVAELNFKFTNAPKGKDWDQIVHVYFTKNKEGIPQETEEMIPYMMPVRSLLSPKNEIYTKFWDADKQWFPHVLDGKKIYAWFVFNEDNKTIKESKIYRVDRFNFCSRFLAKHVYSPLNDKI